MGHRSRVQSGLIVGLALSLVSCSMSESAVDRRDEKQLRKIFNLPETAKMLDIDSAPKTGGWMREGLDIEATFQFSEAEFAGYAQDSRLTWFDLPYPDEMIFKVEGFDPETLDSRPPSPHSDIQSPEDIPKSILAKWKNKWPKARTGQFVCLTAGTNILYERTTSCQKHPKRFNDYIVGVLDPATQQLKIKLQTYY